MTITPIDDHQFLRVLGDELRSARQRQGLIRRQLLPMLSREVSIQAIATYELGTRAASVLRFVELCLALGEQPARLLERTWRRLTDNREDTTSWQIDLTAATRLDDPQLAPLAAWATVQLRTRNDRPTVHLNHAAFTALATICGLDRHELAQRLPR